MKRFIGIVLLAGLVAGCGVKTAYNNLDRLVRWGVSDYVDLSRDQKQLLNQEFATFHRWHRQNHLPLYADFAQELAIQSSDGISVARMTDIVNQVEFWAEEAEAQMNQVVVEVMQTLTDEQVDELPEKLADSNEELAEPEQGLSVAEAQALWAEEYADILKNFIGRLNKEQMAYLQRRSAGYQPERVLWAAYRERWQAELINLLRDRNNAEFPVRYAALVAQRKSFYGPELTSVDRSNRQLNTETAAYVLSNLTPKQSEKFAAALTELATDFRELAAQS